MDQFRKQDKTEDRFTHIIQFVRRDKIKLAGLSNLSDPGDLLSVRSLFTDNKPKRPIPIATIKKTLISIIGNSLDTDRSWNWTNVLFCPTCNVIFCHRYYSGFHRNVDLLKLKNRLKTSNENNL